MPLRVVQSPGCRRIFSDEELGLRKDDILIDTGSIAESLGYVPTDPDRNTGLLRGGGANARRGDSGGERSERQRRCPNVQPAKRAASLGTDGARSRRR